MLKWHTEWCIPATGSLHISAAYADLTDLQYSPEDIPKLLEKIAEGYDIASIFFAEPFA